MKKVIFALSLFSLFVGTTACALTFNDVGGYDSYKASGDIHPSNELSWIADIYGYAASDLTFTKWESDSSSDPQWQTTTDENSVIFLDFGSDGSTDYPFAFLIKAASEGAMSFNDGSTATGAYSTFLFDNNPDTQYGVVDMDWFSKTNGKFSLETISHTSFTFVEGGGGGGGNPVPEPSTLILLGAGLVGLVAYRRCR